MIIEIDFNSTEAIYIQLRNQIVYGIATARFKEGDSLPSVRALAEEIGINMHTVNKAYTVLRQEGFVNADKLMALEEIDTELHKLLAKASCRGISRDEIHAMIDDIYEEYGGI